MKTPKAPAFSLLDQHGVRHELKDYQGRWLVVYFYPLDGSLNCTRETCSFRDEYKVIAQFGNAEIIGVNKGSVASHRRFSEDNRINFPLLSDPKHVITSAYGAWRTSPVKLRDRPFGTRRNTYIINPSGEIVKTFYNVDPDDHATEVIEALQALQSHASRA
jgi:peroxiredoxin Q/BCP